MIEVRAAAKNDGGCMACEPNEHGVPPPTLLAVSAGGNPSTFTTRLCDQCALKLLHGLAFMYTSATGKSIAAVLGLKKPRARKGPRR